MTKYKSKCSTDEFLVAKDVTNVVRVNVAHRPHAIFRIDLDVETVSSLLDDASHHVHPHI